jgi:hypothetical protein
MACPCTLVSYLRNLCLPQGQESSLLCFRMGVLRFYIMSVSVMHPTFPLRMV